MLKNNKNKDTCACAKGKKWKKYCLGQCIKINDFEHMVIKIDELLPEDCQDDREELPPEAENIFAVFHEFYNGIGNPFTQEEIDILLGNLRELAIHFPENPVAMSHLYNSFIILKKQDDADAMIYLLQNVHPKYLFGRLLSVRNALRHGDVDKALHYLKNSHTLMALAPTRVVFHVQEVLVFHKLLLECFIIKNNEEYIVRHYHNINYLFHTIPEALDRYNTLLKLVNRFVKEWSANR